jgi:hypothetical protein
MAAQNNSKSKPGVITTARQTTILLAQAIYIETLPMTNPYASSRRFFVLTVTLFAVTSHAFFLPQKSVSSKTLLHGSSLPPPPPSSDSMPEEENTVYSGSVDWDEEWKKVVREQQKTGTTTSERPGKNVYKSDVEIAAIRAANKATQKVNQMAENLLTKDSGINLPSWNSVKGDWKVRHECIVE